MQTIIITGNLAADCEILKGKDDKEFIRFVVATRDGYSDKVKDDAESKPTYYNCRIKKSSVSDYLKKGRAVTVSGSLNVSTNVKDDKTFVNLDIWVSNLELAPQAKPNGGEDS